MELVGALFNDSCCNLILLSCTLYINLTTFYKLYSISATVIPRRENINIVHVTQLEKDKDAILVCYGSMCLKVFASNNVFDLSQFFFGIKCGLFSLRHS